MLLLSYWRFLGSWTLRHSILNPPAAPHSRGLPGSTPGFSNTVTPPPPLHPAIGHWHRPLLLHRRLDTEAIPQPLWRDGQSDDGEGVQQVSPRPVWRDSGDTSYRLRDSAPFPSREYKRDPRGHTTPSAAPQPHSGDITRSRSLSPLGALLRRACAHSAIHVSGKLKQGKLRQGAPGRNQRRKVKATSRKKPGGKAVWKDTPAQAESTNGGVLRTLKNLAAFTVDIKIAAEEGGSRRIVADRPPPPRSRLPRATSDNAIPVPPPVHENISQLWGKVAQEGRGGTPVYDDASPIAVPRPGGPRLRQSRSRRLVARSGSVLSVATSSATAAWKSIASIPDDLAQSPRSLSTSARHRSRRQATNAKGDEQPRRMLEGCDGDTASSIRKATRERPRAPAFEPWRFRDEKPRPSQTEAPADLNMEWYWQSGRDGEEAESLSLPRLEAGRHEEYGARRDSARYESRRCRHHTSGFGENEIVPIGHYGAPRGATWESAGKAPWSLLAGMDRASSRDDGSRRRPRNNRHH